MHKQAAAGKQWPFLLLVSCKQTLIKGDLFTANCSGPLTLSGNRFQTLWTSRRRTPVTYVRGTFTPFDTKHSLGQKNRKTPRRSIMSWKSFFFSFFFPFLFFSSRQCSSLLLMQQSLGVACERARIQRQRPDQKTSGWRDDRERDDCSS